FLLGECTKESSNSVTQPCLLSRLINPSFRDIFADRVARAICDNLETSLHEPVHYASFWPGMLFQDLVILTKVLAEKPNACLVVHGIDLQFKPYTDFLDYANISHAFPLKEKMDL